MTHLLDSSAFLAYFFNEPGKPRVEQLLTDETASLGLSVLTASEFWSRLKQEGREAVFDEEWADHLPLFDAILPVDWAVTQRAVAIRRATPSRLPTIDSLIAASAAVQSAVLVHRDPHFRAIPGELLQQEFLE